MHGLTGWCGCEGDLSTCTCRFRAAVQWGVVSQAAVQWGVVAQVHRVVSLSGGRWSYRLTGRGGLERDLSACRLKGWFVSGKKSI